MNAFWLTYSPLLVTLIQGCEISLNNDLGEPQPLVLRLNKTFGVHLPSNRDRIELLDQEVVHVICPGSHLLVKNIRYANSSGRIVCKNGKFEINQTGVLFSDLSCEALPEHVARFTNKTCLGKFKEIEIGFMVTDQFLKVMEVCFDDVQDNTVYSKYNLTKTISGFQFGFPRRNWIQGSFYRSINVNNLYTRNNQRRTINNLLGLDPDSFKYVKEFGNLFLARGHLTARADFLYGSLQQSTFYFLNAAPQWHTFNAGNWMTMESNVRRFCSGLGKDLVVYTGTYGISTLPHATTGEEIELFLDVFGNRASRIPVPQLYWKVLYEPVSKAGVVLLGVNNPYVRDVEKHIICEDICGEISWLTWRKENVTAGYGYCCTIEDFRRTVNRLPEFEVLSLLK